MKAKATAKDLKAKRDAAKAKADKLKAERDAAKAKAAKDAAHILW